MSGQHEFWAVYLVDGGEIVRFGQGPAGGALGIEVGPGQALYIDWEIPARGETHYFASGELRAYSAEQIAAKRARPLRAGYRWSNASMSWTDARPLGEIKQGRTAEINAARAAAEAVLTHAGVQWDADPASATRVLVAAFAASRLSGAAATAFSIEWGAADNTSRTLNRAELLALASAIAGHQATQFAKARAKKAQVNAATNAAEVAAVNWD